MLDTSAIVKHLGWTSYRITPAPLPQIFSYAVINFWWMSKSLEPDFDNLGRTELLYPSTERRVRRVKEEEESLESSGEPTSRS